MLLGVGQDPCVPRTLGFRAFFSVLGTVGLSKNVVEKGFGGAANLSGFWRALGVRGAAKWPLHDERGVDVVIVVLAVMLDLLLPVFSKMVNSNAIGFRVDDGE